MKRIRFYSLCLTIIAIISAHPNMNASARVQARSRVNHALTRPAQPKKISALQVIQRSRANQRSHDSRKTVSHQLVSVPQSGQSMHDAMQKNSSDSLNSHLVLKKVQADTILEEQKNSYYQTKLGNNEDKHDQFVPSAQIDDHAQKVVVIEESKNSDVVEDGSAHQDETKQADQVQDEQDPVKNMQEATRDFAEKPVFSRLQSLSNTLKKTYFYINNPIAGLKNSPWQTTQNFGESIQNRVDELPDAAKSLGKIIYKRAVGVGAASLLMSFGLPQCIAVGIWSVADRSFWMEQIFQFFCKKSGLQNHTKTILEMAYNYFFKVQKGTKFFDYVQNSMTWNAKSGLYDSVVGIFKNNSLENQSLAQETLKESIKEFAVMTAIDLDKDYALAQKITAIMSAGIAFYNKAWISAISQLYTVICT